MGLCVRGRVPFVEGGLGRAGHYGLWIVVAESLKHYLSFIGLIIYILSCMSLSTFKLLLTIKSNHQHDIYIFACHFCQICH
jgi:hypothetical protein